MSNSRWRLKRKLLEEMYLSSLRKDRQKREEFSDYINTKYIEPIKQAFTPIYESVKTAFENIVEAFGRAGGDKS